jgi:ArsR family transcriptional regulator
MHYKVRELDSVTASILAATLSRLESDRAMQADRARLDRACCQPQKFVSLQGAPKPSLMGSELS